MLSAAECVVWLWWICLDMVNEKDAKSCEMKSCSAAGENFVIS